MPGFKQLLGPVYRETLVKQFGPQTKTLLILPDNVSDSRKKYEDLHTGLRGGLAGPMRPNIVQNADGTMGYDIHCVGVPSMKDTGAVPDESEVEASFVRIYELLGTGAYTQVAVPYRNRSVHGGATATGTEPSFRGNIAAYDPVAQKMFDKHFRYLEEFMNDPTLSLDQRLAKLPQKYQDAYKRGLQSPDKDPINNALKKPIVQQSFKQLYVPAVAPKVVTPIPQLTNQQKVFRASVGQKVATKLKESGIEFKGKVFINNTSKSTNIEFQFENEAIAQAFCQKLHEGVLGEKISSAQGTPKVPFQHNDAYKVTLTAQQYEKLTTNMGLGTENKPVVPQSVKLPVSTTLPPNSDPAQAVLSMTTPSVTHAHQKQADAPKSQQSVVSDPQNSIAHISAVLSNPEKCSELGISKVHPTSDGLKLNMKEPVTNIHIKNAKDSGVTYSADQPMKPGTIQQVCDIALLTANADTEFNLSGVDPQVAKEAHDYLTIKIAQIFKDKPESEKPKIIGFQAPPEPAIEPSKQTL